MAKVIEIIKLNEAMRIGSNLIGLIFLYEEETGHRHTQKRLCKDTGRRWLCARQRGKPQKKPALPTL